MRSFCTYPFPSDFIQFDILPVPPKWQITVWFHLFLKKSQIVPYCLYIPQFLYPVIYCRALGFSPDLGYCVINIGTYMSFWNSILRSLKKMLRSGIAGLYSSAVLWEVSILLSKEIKQIDIPTMWDKGSSFSLWFIIVLLMCIWYKASLLLGLPDLTWGKVNWDDPWDSGESK